MFSKGFFPRHVKRRHCVGMGQVFTKEQNFNPLPDNKILDWSKLKQIADDILKWI